MICRICGCSDWDACVDPDSGESCNWTEPDLCSFCAAAAVLAQVEQDGSVGLESEDRPLVEVFSEHEADRYIRARRAGAA